MDLEKLISNQTTKKKKKKKGKFYLSQSEDYNPGDYLP